MAFYQAALSALRVSVIGGLLCFCTVGYAQEKPVEDASKLLVETQNYAKALREAAEALKAENTELRKRVEGKEAALWTKFYEAKTAEYTFQQEMLDVNISAFRHQKVASYVILLLVVLVVGGGLFFAHVQLMAGLQPIAAAAAGAAAAVQAGGDNAAVPAPAAAVPAAAPNFGVNTFSAEMGKVTITSSVVGVVVLVISLAFLFIYTREVYHIQVIDPYRPSIADPSKPKPEPPSEVKK